MKKIVTLVLTAVFLTAGTFGWAQPPKGNPGAKEIREYFKNNIRPELIKQQAKFLSVLSDEEIAQLDKIKNDWKKVRAEMHGKTTPENRKNTQKAHYTAFSSQIEKIADAHPKEKEAYIKTMSAKKEQWKKDIEAIRTKYNMPENNKGSKLMENIDKPAFILMWDPNRHYGKKHAKKPAGKKPYMHKKGMKAKNTEPGIKIFPYPAKSTVTVRITGTKGKDINAAVYDANGKKMKELFNAKSTLPALNFSFDVSNWNNGMYVVKAKFGERTLTYDFKVEK